MTPTTMSSEQTNPESRRRPNVLITGTPGVGKTALAELLEVRIHERNTRNEYWKHDVDVGG